MGGFARLRNALGLLQPPKLPFSILTVTFEGHVSELLGLRTVGVVVPFLQVREFLEEHLLEQIGVAVRLRVAEPQRLQNVFLNECATSKTSRIGVI